MSSSVRAASAALKRSLSRLPRLPRALRGRDARLFALVFWILALAALVPLWRVRFLPLLDQPNHLSSIYIWHHFKDPLAGLQEFYELNIQPVPYFAYYFLVHCVAFATGVEVANKIVLSAYVLSLPAAALLWTRRTRRSPWLSIFAFPLAYSYSWSYGFLPFNIGVAAFLMAVVAVDVFLERPRAGLVVAVLLLGLACYLGHPLTLVALYASVLALLIGQRPPWARGLAALVLLLPSAALVAWQVLRPQVSIVAKAGASGIRYEGYHPPWREMLAYLPRYTLDSVSGGVDLAVFAVVAVSALSLFLTGLLSRYREPETHAGRSRLYSYRGALIMVAMLICYLVGPLHLSKPFDWWFVSGRFATFICFFAFLLPDGSIRGLRKALIAPAAIAALVLPLHISTKYAEFNERARPFIGMMDRVRPGASVLFLAMKPRSDEAVNVEAYNQFAAWTQILKGGYAGSGWFNSGYPFTMKKSLPGPPWYSSERFDPALHAGPYAYVIVHNEKAQRPIFPAMQPEWRLVEREGAWSMYERAAPSH